VKVLVSIKRVVDYQLQVRPTADGQAADTAGLKMSMNPFDEIAVEEAVRLREAGIADEAVAVACGPAASQDVLRTALAMGIDRAILIVAEHPLQPLAVARLLKVLALREAPDLILMGKQAIDDDAAQTPQMLAAMLGWPQAIFASKIEVAGMQANVAREVDAGIEVVQVSLPAVISADLRLNTPRFASLPNVMKARRAVIEQIPAEGTGVDLAPRLETLSVAEVPPRPQGICLESVEALAERLQQARRALQ